MCFIPVPFWLQTLPTYSWYANWQLINHVRFILWGNLEKASPQQTPPPPKKNGFAFDCPKKKKQCNSVTMKSNATCIKLMRCINPFLSFQRKQEGGAHITIRRGTERPLLAGGRSYLPVFQNKWHVIFGPFIHHHTFVSSELDIHLHYPLHGCWFVSWCVVRAS